MRSHRGRRLAGGLGLVAGPRSGWLPSGATHQSKTWLASMSSRPIRYCRGEYRLTMASGTCHRAPESDLRLETDGSREGPECETAGVAARQPGGGTALS